MNGQVARHLPFIFAGALYLLALEGDRRVLLGVQKVGAPQMRIPLLVHRFDAARIDSGLDSRLARIVRVVHNRALHLAKSATNIRDHHVPD